MLGGNGEKVGVEFEPLYRRRYIRAKKRAAQAEDLDKRRDPDNRTAVEAACAYGGWRSRKLT